MFLMTLADWFGTVGVSILLIAFFLNLRNIVAKEDLAYIVLNLAGGAIALIASVLLKFWPFIILEICWTLVSAWELVGYFRERK